jgi:hypothetical protein
VCSHMCSNRGTLVLTYGARLGQAWFRGNKFELWTLGFCSQSILVESYRLTCTSGLKFKVSLWIMSFTTSQLLFRLHKPLVILLCAFHFLLFLSTL